MVLFLKDLVLDVLIIIVIFDIMVIESGVGVVVVKLEINMMLGGDGVGMMMRRVVIFSVLLLQLQQQFGINGGSGSGGGFVKLVVVNRNLIVDIDMINFFDFFEDVLVDNFFFMLVMLKKIDNYIVLDCNGKLYMFWLLYMGWYVVRRVLFVFVRYFYCGVCVFFDYFFCGMIDD